MQWRECALLVLAAVTAAFVVPTAAVAQEPEPVSELRVKVAGAVELSALADAGIDVEHDITRVPDGIEAEVHVTKAQELRLLAHGRRRSCDPGRSSSGASRPRRSPRPEALPRPPAPTVRVVRADYFSTKGQGFLYVEARTTQGAQTTPVVAMTLENDTGAGPRSCRRATMSRFVDSGVYMFHRNLFKVSRHAADQIRVTLAAPGGVAIGKVSEWLDDVTPMTADPGYKSDFVDDYKTPQQLYSRFEQIAQQYPDIAEIVALPNKTNGYQRKAQADDRRHRRRPRWSSSSAAWGHEGGNGITVEMVNRPGADLPLAVEVTGKAVRVLLAKNAAGAVASTAAQVAAAIEAGSPSLIDRAHPYRTNAGTGIVAATTAPVVADRLPRSEAHRRARGRGAARPVHDPRAADRQVTATAPSPAC